MKYISLISGIFTILCISLIILYQKNDLDILLNDLTNKRFIIWILGIIIYSTYILNNKSNTKESQKVKSATKKALVALIIAYFAKLDLVIAPFWIVWVFCYYTNEKDEWV